MTKSTRKQTAQKDKNDKQTTFHFKIALLGDPGVGKTSIAHRLTQATFETSSKQTIGVDFYVKEIFLPESVHVTIQIWDIGGQTLGTKMLANYIFGSSAVLLVYDVTLAQSFTNLKEWVGFVDKTFGDERPYTAIIANKSDLRNDRAVPPKDHNAFVRDNNLYSYSVSAKTGDHVVAALHRIAADLAGVRLQNDFLRNLSGGVLQVPVQEADGELSNEENTPPQSPASNKRCGAGLVAFCGKCCRIRKEGKGDAPGKGESCSTGLVEGKFTCCCWDFGKAWVKRRVAVGSDT